MEQQIYVDTPQQDLWMRDEIPNLTIAAYIWSANTAELLTEIKHVK